jgi:hypothetical protein
MADNSAYSKREGTRVRLALGQERERLQLPRRARSWLEYGLPASTVLNAFKNSSDELSLST